MLEIDVEEGAAGVSAAIMRDDVADAAATITRLLAIAGGAHAAALHIPLGIAVDSSVEAIERRDGAGKALEIMDAIAPLVPGHIVLSGRYISSLVHVGRHADALVFSDVMLGVAAGNGWAWYWAIWGALEAADFERAERHADAADARLGELPELALARMLLLGRLMRTAKLIEHITSRPDLRTSFPGVSAEFLISARLASRQYRDALGDLAAMGGESIPPLDRLSLLWRTLNATLVDPQAERSLIDAVAYGVVQGLCGLPDDDSQIIVILLRRLAELHYKDAALYLECRAHMRRSVTRVELRGSRIGRMLAFAIFADGASWLDARDDLIGLVSENVFQPAYFLLSPEWTVFPQKSVAGDIDFKSDAGRFLKYLLALADEPQHADRHLRGGKSRGGAASDALVTISDARQAMRQADGARASASARTRLKIAVCISGQLRGYKSAHATWDRLGLARHDTRYFVHSWYDVGRKSPTAQNLDRAFSGAALDAVTSFFSAEDLGAFTRRYPGLIRALGAAGRAEEADLRDLYGTDQVILEDDQKPPYAGLSNSEKMYRKIRAAHEMARSSGERFDLILRIRPDLAFTDTRGSVDLADLLGRSEADGLFFADRFPILHLEMGLIYGDQLAIGCTAVMDAYSQSYDFIRAEGGRTFQVPSLYLPHSSLVWNCVYKGIQSRGIPTLGATDLYGPDPLAPAHILSALEQDLAAREMDAFDHQLLAACRTDAAGQR